MALGILLKLVLDLTFLVGFFMLDIEFDFTICGLGPMAQGHKRE